jgi:hypothetical protein
MIAEQEPGPWGSQGRGNSADLADIREAPPQAQRRPVSHPSDHIRRAALAIRENWSNDTMKLARIALEGAYHSEADLLEAWPAPNARPTSRRELDHRSAMIKELRGCERVIFVTAA